jgi:hypothetical protein
MFQLYRGSQFHWWRKPEYSENTTHLSQVTDELYHIMLYRVHLVTIRIRNRNYLRFATTWVHPRFCFCCFIVFFCFVFVFVVLFFLLIFFRFQCRIFYFHYYNKMYMFSFCVLFPCHVACVCLYSFNLVFICNWRHWHDKWHMTSKCELIECQLTPGTRSHLMYRSFFEAHLVLAWTWGHTSSVIKK